MTGKQSVGRCTALRNPAGLGAIGRVVVAVRFGIGMRWVSRCTGQDLPAVPGRLQFFYSQKHNPFLHSLVRSLMTGVHIPQLHGAMQHLPLAMVTAHQSPRTRDLDPLRRLRLERDQFRMFLEEF